MITLGSDAWHAWGRHADSQVEYESILRRPRLRRDLKQIAVDTRVRREIRCNASGSTAAST